MAGDELTKPLGLPAAQRSTSRRRLIATLAGLTVIIAAVGAVWFVPGPVSSTSDPVAAAPDKKVPAIARTSRPLAPGESALVETVPDGALSEIGADQVIISDPNAPSALHLGAAPLEELIEDGPHGLLPRIGPDGTRPMEAYARPVDPDSGSVRRIAIVVGGIGIARDGSTAAIDQLPGAVTLAFAPYAENLPQLLARARDTGHEVLLQVPLEPYGYPNNDPGPHTLTIDAPAEENLDRLHWLMSRLTTYVGVTNYLGARFTSDEAAFEPVIAEIGERGLLYFDDGSSGTSRADQLAKGRTPFIRADAVIDAETDAKAIDARLAELEALARRRGYAVASASAFPISIERIVAFAKAAAARGIEIVPLTAIVATDRS